MATSLQSHSRTAQLQTVSSSQKQRNLPAATHNTPSRLCVNCPNTRPFVNNVLSAKRIAPLKAAALEDAQSTGAASGQEEWYALVANAEFMLNDVQNESFAEQLRERTRHFKETNQEINFFLVSEPAWLDEKFPKEAKLVRRPCVALVSSDPLWTTFMKLRLDRVLKIDLGKTTAEEATKSLAPVPEFAEPLGKGKWTAPYSPYAPGWWKPFVRE